MEKVKKKRPEIFQQTALDKVVSYFSPVAGRNRMQARAQMALAGGYYSGDRGRKSMKRWALSGGSADAEILPNLEKLRSDSRDLMRKAPLARSVASCAGHWLTSACSFSGDRALNFSTS